MKLNNHVEQIGLNQTLHFALVKQYASKINSMLQATQAEGGEDSEDSSNSCVASEKSDGGFKMRLEIGATDGDSWFSSVGHIEELELDFILLSTEKDKLLPENS